MTYQKPETRLLSALVIVMCLLGFFVRLYFYGINRSLWLDEAMLALNIVNRSFAELLQPLSYDQGAPIGFLLLQKIVIGLLGNWDYVLRLIPLIAGLLSIPLMYQVSKKYSVGIAPYVASGLFVLSAKLIYYSSELKQYSSDVLVALVILLTAQKCLEVNANKRALVVFGVSSVLAIWFSHPILFVIAAVFLALVLSLFERQNSHQLLHIIGTAGVFGISLLLLYVVSLRNLASNDVLLNYWSGSFAPLPPWSNPGWYYDTLLNVLVDLAGLPGNLISVGVLILGIFSLGSRRWPLMLILVVPFPLTLIASALGKYPFSGRLLLFLIPFLLLLLAEGIERVRSLLLRMNKQIALLAMVALVGYLFYNPVMTVHKDLRFPPKQEDIKPVMEYLQQNKTSADLVYVYYGAEFAFRYYAPFYGLDTIDYVPGIPARDDPVKYFDDIDRVRENRRVWFVFSHNCSWCAVNEQRFIVEHLNEVGLKKSESIASDAAVYLYELP